MFVYETKDVCSSKISFDIKDGKVFNISFEDGCDGNLKALSVLIEGMDAEELVSKLKGIRCEDRKTSCCDQLALAVEKYAKDFT